MGDVVNLSRERKRAERRKDAGKADANRRLSGRTKSEKRRDDLQKGQQERRLDGAKLEDFMKKD